MADGAGARPAGLPRLTKHLHSCLVRGSDNQVPARQPTRLHMLARLVWLCFFSVAMVLGGNLLLVLPQIREGLFAFDDGEGDALRRQVIFAFAFLYWASTTWYVARLTLGRRFPYDSVGSLTSPFVNCVAQWLPRLLALAATVPLTLFLLGTGKHPVLAVVLLALSILFVIFTWNRRRLMGSEESAYYRYYSDLKAASWCALAAIGVVPFVVLLAILASPIDIPRTIGAPALMLLAVGAWSLVGGMLLSYWPRTRGWIPLGWLPLVLLVAFSASNDNHPIDWHAGPWRAASESAAKNDARPQLKQHYEAWIKQHPPGAPVYVVASAGGASRASYWAGVVLGRLEDEARETGASFGRSIFMLSGISGGSVGIASFASALRAWPAKENEKAPPCIRLAMDQFLGADVLSPVGAMMLYPDMMQRFVPAINWSQHIDRSRGLEQAWAQDWEALVAKPPEQCGKGLDPALGGVWSRPFTEVLNAQPGAPMLVLNSVRLEDGRRVLQSNVQLSLRDADDLLGDGFEARARESRLAAAVHNSARFPLVSPPGTVRAASGVVWGHLGDGGYHEVTGTATVADVIEELLALGCLWQDPPRIDDVRPTRLYARPQCDRASAQAATKVTDKTIDDAEAARVIPKESRVIVVLLDNTPTGFPAEWQRDLDGRPRVWSDGERVDMDRLATPEPIEFLGPFKGLVSQSAERSRSAERRLSALAGTAPDSVIELRLPRYRGRREPSMNWQLDRDSRQLMMCAAQRFDKPDQQILSVSDADASCTGEKDGQLPRKSDRAANLADEALKRNLQRLRVLIQSTRPVAAPAPSGAASTPKTTGST